jgi:hypothetical protein
MNKPKMSTVVCIWGVHSKGSCVGGQNSNTVLRGSGNITKWGLVGGSKSLGACLWWLYLVPSLIPPTPHLPWGEQSPLPHTPITRMFCPSAQGSSDHGLNPLKPWTKINPSSFKLFMLGILSQWQNN